MSRIPPIRERFGETFPLVVRNHAADAAPPPDFASVGALRRAFVVADLTAYARRLPFVRLPWWIQHPKVSPPMLAVYAALVSFADLRTGQCWPSIAAIAERAAVHRATAVRALAALEALGVVSRERKYDADGQTNNLYTVQTDPEAVPDALADPVDNSPADAPVSRTKRLTPVAQSDSPPSHKAPRNESHLNENQGNEQRASAPASDPRCTRHVGVADPPACRGCRDARITAETSAAAEAEAEKERRAAALVTLDPAAVEALSVRLGGLYSAEAITEAARAEMPGNLPLGLRMLASRADAADAVARWER